MQSGDVPLMGGFVLLIDVFFLFFCFKLSSLLLGILLPLCFFLLVSYERKKVEIIMKEKERMPSRH